MGAARRHDDGTVGTDEKAEIARWNGCAHAIVTSREDIRETLTAKGVPLSDSVGKDTLIASLDSLQRAVSSSATASSAPSPSMRPLAMKGLCGSRPAMIHYATPRARMLDMAKSSSVWCLPERSPANQGSSFRCRMPPKPTAHSIAQDDRRNVLILRRN